MVNILVPTDFSKLSAVAVAYAVGIANTLKGNVTMLHVIDIGEKVKATLRMQPGSRDVLNTAKSNFQQLVEELSSRIEIHKPITYKIAKGRSFVDAISKESKSLHSGLVVMGTRGASGLKKAMMGSNTASLIGTSHIPVLAVPGEAMYSGFRNMIYATDLKNLDAELAVLIPYVKQFDSTVHILHIADDASEIDNIEQQIEIAVKKTGYKNIVTLVTFDTDVEGAIEHYITVSHADLLTMFTHEPSFYEKVFDKSVTRKMAFHSRIPLLAFKHG
jgi:nucleotide-binding universal stress UspA family protein